MAKCGCQDKVRVGIIGCGGIANGKHMPGLARLDCVEMVAFVILLRKGPEKPPLNTVPMMQRCILITENFLKISLLMLYIFALPTDPMDS